MVYFPVPLSATAMRLHFCVNIVNISASDIVRFLLRRHFFDSCFSYGQNITPTGKVQKQEKSLFPSVPLVSVVCSYKTLLLFWESIFIWISQNTLDLRSVFTKSIFANALCSSTKHFAHLTNALFTNVPWDCHVFFIHDNRYSYRFDVRMYETVLRQNHFWCLLYRKFIVFPTVNWSKFNPIWNGSQYQWEFTAQRKRSQSIAVSYLSSFMTPSYELWIALLFERVHISLSRASFVRSSRQFFLTCK